MFDNLPISPQSSLPAESVGRAGEDGRGQAAASGPYLVDQGTDWRRLVAGVWRYKWLVLLLVVGGTGAGVTLTRFIDPLYQANATLWIEQTQRGQRLSGPIQAGELLKSYAWVDLLKTYLVLDSVAVNSKLYLQANPADSTAFAGFALKERFDPGSYELSVDAEGRRFELSSGDGVRLQQGVLGDSVGLQMGFSWVPEASALESGSRTEFRVAHPRDVAMRLAQSLKARMDQNANFLRLTLTDRDPDRAEFILNAITERYTQVVAHLKSEKLEQISAILDTQRSYAEGRLRDAEAALERFRVETVTLPSERASPVAPGLEQTRNPAFANFFNLKIEQDQLGRDRESIERVLAQASDSGLAVAALEFIPSVQAASELATALNELTAKRAELRALRLMYTAAHPLFQRADDDVQDLEQGSIPELAARLVEELRARESELEGLIASASGELSEVPTRAIEESGLERRVEIAANFNTELQLRHEEALLAAANAIPDVRVLDPAIAPRRPVNRDNTERLILMAFMGSLGLGLAGAILLDRIDPRIKYPDQVSLELGLPILGVVPYVREHDRIGSLVRVNQVVEAFRLIRLNLFHAYGAAGPLVVAITSPAGSEGKSFVTLNLALSFSTLGRRVLVIDGDVRRGYLNRVLGAVRKPGLTDNLAGIVNLDTIVRLTPYSNLDLIACGARRERGPELLQSNAMASLLAKLRASYEVILIDTPPLSAGADAMALGTLTGNVLVVVRAGSTDRELTEAKLDILDRLPLRTLGAVLNAVPRRGYYYERHYAYLPGYEVSNEADVGNDELFLDSTSSREESARSEQLIEEEAQEVVDESGVTDADDASKVPPSEEEELADPKHGGGFDYHLHQQYQRRNQLRRWR